MKNLVKYFGISLIILASFGCEEEANFIEPTIELTTVYSLTNISGNTPVKINIYRNKNLIIEYASGVNPLSFSSANYSDTSTDTNYEISVSKVDNQNTVSYVISADKVSGSGTLTIDATSVHNISISEEEVYN